MAFIPSISVNLRLSAERSLRIASIALANLIVMAGLAAGQIQRDAPAESNLRYGEPVTTRYQVGVELSATRGAVRDVVAMIAIPFECPEQEVARIEEDFSSQVEAVDYRTLQGGVTQMLVRIPWLADGQTARAVVTFDVATRTTLPPEETDHLLIPKRPDKDARRYLTGSAFIQVNHRTIKALAKKFAAEVDKSATDWERVEAIYNHVIDNIAYAEGADKTAVDTLRDGFADCYGRSALFIALCRASKVPARMVWVQGHAYPEFYLEDAEGKGQWYPCESAGTVAFGAMPMARVVLQKGDNFRVPERSGERLRYASDFMLATPAPGSGRPRDRFIREQLGGSQESSVESQKPELSPLGSGS